jgi:hypothetical protein
MRGPPPSARKRHRCCKDRDTRESGAPDAGTPDGRAGRVGVTLGSNTKDSDWPCDILDLLFAEVLKVQLQLVPDVIPHRTRDDDPARLCQPFQPGGDIDPIAIDVISLNDNIAEVDPDAEGDVLVGPKVRVPLADALLNPDRAAHSLDDTGELRQEAVAGFLDEGRAMCRGRSLDQIAIQSREARVSTLLVARHEATVARDVGDHNRGQPSLGRC